VFYLVVGIGVFIGVHLFTAVTQWRRALVARLGEWPYKGLFTLIALSSLVLAIWGYSQAGHYLIWEGPYYGYEIGLTLMPVATVFLVAAYLPSNIKRLTAHPMLWGVVLWSISHLLVQGHWAALILFGGLGLYALAAMAIATARGVRPLRTRQALWKEVVVIVIGLVIYGVLLSLHPVLFGATVIV
jgi:uncharacterized membrane protein